MLHYYWYFSLWLLNTKTKRERHIRSKRDGCEILDSLDMQYVLRLHKEIHVIMQ